MSKRDPQTSQGQALRVKRSCPRSPHSLAAQASLAIAVLLCSAQLSAQAGARPRGRVLHERPPSEKILGRSDRVVERQGGPKEALPAAIETASGRIEQPSAKPTELPVAHYEPRGAGPSALPDRVRPDRRTGGEGELNYRVVFNPTVTPFKRDRVLDQVASDGSLEVSGRGRRRLLPQGEGGRSSGSVVEGRELFWGHVVLELRPGRDTPLPSVAPSSRLLRYLATPPRSLSFYTDRAGNQSVRSARAGRVTLRFLVDAPSTYFAAPLGDGPVKDDPWRPAVPDHLKQQLKELWPALDVHPTRYSRRHNLEALVRWFRGFHAGAPPERRQGAVSDLIVARRGVCRHRSLGFVAMAQSLGIPAQYVMNDAHAFVEVWALDLQGRGGWLRIDLGGSAETLNLHGARDKHLHRPLYADPLPRPPGYAQEAGFGGVLNGLGSESWAGARRLTGAEGMIDGGPPAERKGPEQERGAGVISKPSVKRPAAVEAVKPPGAGRDWMRRRALAVAALRLPPPAEATRPLPRAPGDKRARTALVLDPHVGLAYVGELLRVRGRLLVEGDPPRARLSVEIWLVDLHHPLEGLRLGSALARVDGRFEARVQIPLEAQLGSYDLVVRFSGDLQRAPSFSLSL